MHLAAGDDDKVRIERQSCIRFTRLPYERHNRGTWLNIVALHMYN